MDTFLPATVDPIGRFRHRASPAVSLAMIMTGFAKEGKLKKLGHPSKKFVVHCNARPRDRRFFFGTAT
ncbi:hypothetical protein J2X36_001300 [Methylobacterium sp. BE186]|uniref:hypothetical protein n=1 Tax=Methylobacterium sp. BE186 TaxID=2817715 RepID=UPI002865564D|nr:hypothetical protein [Methylobacterium sp. BE186]MDR7036559.1 hypothetical protein [Methylobacterium sp. BE186]